MLCDLVATGAGAQIESAFSIGHPAKKGQVVYGQFGIFSDEDFCLWISVSSLASRSVYTAYEWPRYFKNCDFVRATFSSVDRFRR
jgi:hypothetical protein